MPTKKSLFLLMDEIKLGGNMALTKNIKKIFHNIKLMGFENEQDIEIRLPLVEKYLNAINRFGRYLVVIRIKKDETAGSMYAFDFTAQPEESFIKLSNRSFKDNPELAVEFMRHYYDLKSVFSSDSDIVGLSLEEAP